MPCVTLDSFGHVDPENLRLLRIGSKIDFFYLSDEDETMCNKSCSGTVQGFIVDAQQRGRAYTLTRDVRDQIDSGELFYWLDDKKLTKILAIKVLSKGHKYILDTNWLRVDRICMTTAATLASLGSSASLGPSAVAGGRRRTYMRSRLRV